MKKKLILLIFFLLFLVSEVNANSQNTIVVPIKGEINNATAEFVRESLEYASQKNSPVIFEIDTYGGSVVAAEKIKNYIIDYKGKTFSFVNNKAESAGVLITISSKKVYMSKTATIGSAETIPNTEKNMSFWKSILKDTAQYRGRNAEIITAMADSDMSIPGLIEEGKLLNLTSKESLDLGVSDATINSYEELVKLENISTHIEVLEMGLSLRFVNLISNSAFSMLLLILGMIGFVVEVFTPGFGVGGIISIISFTFFFMGNMMAGNSNWYAILVFVLGIVLIGIEMFIPGFGVAGISGIIAVITGLVLAMKTIEVALVSVATAIIITIIVAYFLIKRGAKAKFIQKITLNNTNDSKSGYISVNNGELEIGDKGITITVLKPTGFIRTNGKKIEVISSEGFIEKGQEVEVDNVEGFKIFVRRKKDV